MKKRRLFWIPVVIILLAGGSADMSFYETKPRSRLLPLPLHYKLPQ